MIGLFFSKFKLHAIGAAVFIVGLFGIYIKGRDDANTKQKERKAKADANTHERINRVTPPDPTDRIDVDERLSRLRGER